VRSKGVAVDFIIVKPDETGTQHSETNKKQQGTHNLNQLQHTPKKLGIFSSMKQTSVFKLLCLSSASRTIFFSIIFLTGETMPSQ